MGMYTCYLVDDVQIPNDDLKDSLNFEDKGLLMVKSKLMLVQVVYRYRDSPYCPCL